MSVIVEFSVADEEFALGRVLGDLPDMHVELERLVPTGGAVIPYLWVRGGDYERFERRVVESDAVDAFVALDRLDDWVLYRLEWGNPPDSLLEGIEASNGVILQAIGDEDWVFRLRFPDHEAVSTFYNFCTERGIGIHVDRSYTLTERTESGYQFDLSQEQREAVLLGLRMGYFETPSRASLADLAADLGISEQAVSNRVRRGTERVLRQSLLASAADLD
jgi:hypothetical protein